MFEASKFKKRYQLLAPYIKDKELIKKLVNDKKFYKFYTKEENEIKNFISNLKSIYLDEEVEKIISSELNINNPSSINFLIFRVRLAIYSSQLFDDGSIDVLKGIAWEELKKMTNVHDTIQRKCFDKYNKDNIKIGYYDLSELYDRSQYEITKNRLLEMVKKNQIPFLVSVLNDLSNCKIGLSDLDTIFKNDKTNQLIDINTKNELGENNYKFLISYYFKYSSFTEKENIDLMLQNKNYELIEDLLHLNREYRFSHYVKGNETNKDIFSIAEITHNERLSIILSYMGIKEKMDLDYLNNLKHSVSSKYYERFYKEHKETIELLSKLSYENFCELSIEEQKKLYTYVKSLNVEKRKTLLTNIKDVDTEIKKMYKEEYTATFNSAQSIVEKAVQTEVRESDGKKHNLPIYELKDEEEFTFLITVMHNKARLEFQNMYNRPAHKLTIDNPANFTKDLKGGSEIISTSMINNRFIDTFVGDNADVMYIFSNIKSEDIIGICHEDAALPPKIEEEQPLFPKGKPVGPSQLMHMTINNRQYNEIAIRRKNVDGERIMPTAILCYDQINDTSIKHAEHFNIPIIIINTKTYKSLKGYTQDIKENEGYTRRYK